MAAQLTLIAGMTRQQHVEEICQAGQSSVSGILKTGRRALRARIGPHALPQRGARRIIDRLQSAVIDVVSR
jgi:hypothetical protein